MACGTARGQGPVARALRRARFRRFAVIAAGSGAGTRLDDPSITVLVVPTDRAIDAYLAASTMTMADFTARTQMAGSIMLYAASRAPAGAIDALRPGGPPLALQTLSPGWSVALSRGPAGLQARDSDGNTAPLAEVKVPSVSARVFAADNQMLLPGDVFERFLDGTHFVSLRGGAMTPSFKLISAMLPLANLSHVKNADWTVFIPTDAAFEAAGLSLAAVNRLTPAQQRTQLRGLLAYHGVRGYNPLPSAGLPPGAPAPTALAPPGRPPAAITVGYKPGAAGGVDSATVTDAAGDVANVVGPNRFSGRLTFHIIDRVLTPPPALVAAGAALAPRAAG